MRKNETETGKLRAKLPELYKRKTPYDEQLGGVYANGIDNLYPYENELVILNSPTALRAVDLLKRYISGQGVENDRIVNRKKSYKLSDIVDLISSDVAIQNGCFIWRGFSFNTEKGIFEPSMLDVLDYSNVRIGKEDDNETKGKIFIKDYLSKSEQKYFIRKNEDLGNWFYPFSNNQKIIQSQMLNDARIALGLEKDAPVSLKDQIMSQRGQVYYLNFTPQFKYALSKFDAVYNDMDSEYRFGLYVNREIRTGFTGKTIVLTKGLDAKTSKNITDDLGDLLGSENAGNLLHLEADLNTDLSEVLRIEQIKPQLDNELANNSEKRIRRNILGCANNLPESLAFANENSLFSDSGEKYKALKQFFNENTQNERARIEKTLALLGFETKIIPIV